MIAPDDESVVRRRVASLIRAEINRGTYPPGAKLPSYRQLEESFGVARNTVGAAVGLLQQEGLVDIRPNNGAYVRDLAAVPAAPDLRSELRELRDQLHRTKRELAAAQKRVTGLLDSLPADERTG